MGPLVTGLRTQNPTVTAPIHGARRTLVNADRAISLNVPVVVGYNAMFNAKGGICRDITI